MPIPDAMACNGDIVANLARVEEPRADKLVAEESGLVLIRERPFWRSVTAAGDEGGKGSDDAEDESEALHLVEECDDWLLEVVRPWKGFKDRLVWLKET